MRRLAFVFSLVLFVGSARADITNDVTTIRGDVNLIRSALNLFVYTQVNTIVNQLSAISTVNSNLTSFYNDWYEFAWDVLEPDLQSIIDALGSSGDIVQEIINLNAVMSGIAADSSLIWSILDAVEDGGLIRTDPELSALQNMLRDLGVSVNNFSDLLEELEDWHPDITGDVTATLDGPVVIGEMPPVEVDLSDIDFSYFDDWQADVHSLFESWPSYDLLGYKWDTNVPLGKGAVDNVVDDHVYGSGDWFEQVLETLQFSGNQEGQINRSIIELIAKVAPTNTSEVTSQLQNNLNGLESQIAQLNQMDIENDSSLAKLTSANTVVKDYAKFGGLSSMFSGSGTLGSYIHIHFGDTIDQNGNTLELSGDIPVGDFGGFFDKCRQGASIMWWLLTFLFSALVTFRVFALFRKVNNTFFRMPIGFGA